MRSSAVLLQRARVAATGWQDGVRMTPEETPVAIVHDGSTYAVMMATPQDLEDFAVGFSLTEGVIQSAADLKGLDVVESELGVELRLWLAPNRSLAVAQRRRTLLGATGCGLCGLESLEQAQRTATRQPAPIAPLDPVSVKKAMAALDAGQSLGPATRAVHGAGFWRPGDGLVCLREDVGRHNALDKLAGGMARVGMEPAGLLVLTSRLSVELVQKAAAVGFPVIAAVSAPTALAVRTAEAAGLTLIGVARADGFEVFTHPGRVMGAVRPASGYSG